MIQRKILTVEDTFEVRIAIEMALTQEGYLVRTSVDGESGLHEFAEFSPDLALLDIRMPGMSGIELCRRLREISNIPIVIFSAVEDQAEKLDAFDAGADDYVVKGTGIDELLVRVAAQLRWKREALKDPVQADDENADTEVWGQEDLAHIESSSAPPDAPSPRGGKERKRTLRPRYPRIRVPRYEGEKGTPILVADPDPAEREKLARALKNMGHPVIETESGLQTLRTIGKYLPWLVMCEMVMPDIDGKHMLKLVYEHPRTQDIAVVVVTQKGSPKARDVANRYGALDFIVKPWDREEIALRIDWARRSLARKKTLYEGVA